MLFEHEPEVLFVDDDEDLRTANVQMLELANVPVRAFSAAGAALNCLSPNFGGVVVSDIRMPGMDGLQLLDRVKVLDPDIPVILMTGHGDVPMALDALRRGAMDFLTKPFSADQLVVSIEKALKMRALILDNRRLRDSAALTDAETNPLVGTTPAMVRLRHLITQLASTSVDVLIEGETGTGKELVARLLHMGGPRRTKRFVAVNCGALPEAIAEAELFGTGDSDTLGSRSRTPGRIEQADGGTLFLDEVDSMSPAVQLKLLRVLEEREIQPIASSYPKSIDLRVLAATKVDLAAAVERGQFRADLFYRLNVLCLRVPPLRERAVDIPMLFASFLQEACAQAGLEQFRMNDRIRRHLLLHMWPGNVRELRNFAYQVVFGLVDEDGAGAADTPLPVRLERLEAEMIRDALSAAGGSIKETTERLGVPRKTLYDKITRYGIDLTNFRPER